MRPAIAETPAVGERGDSDSTRPRTHIGSIPESMHIPSKSGCSTISAVGMMARPWSSPRRSLTTEGTIQIPGRISWISSQPDFNHKDETALDLFPEPGPCLPLTQYAIDFRRTPQSAIGGHCHHEIPTAHQPRHNDRPGTCCEHRFDGNCLSRDLAPFLVFVHRPNYRTYLRKKQAWAEGLGDHCHHHQRVAVPLLRA